jgi:hypothetical protein
MGEESTCRMDHKNRHKQLKPSVAKPAREHKICKFGNPKAGFAGLRCGYVLCFDAGTIGA